MKLITNQQLRDMMQDAGDLPRLRNHLIIHESPEDQVQRLFIGLRKGTYVRPHRHLNVGELGVVIRGACDLLNFDDQGIITRRTALGPGGDALAFDLTPGEWHTLVVKSDEVLFLEAKPGPYDPEVISDFAAWAPPEGGEAVAAFQEWLREAEVGDNPTAG